jgi:(p)ppGpp synthase/HD superfamily hydrolase
MLVGEPRGWKFDSDVDRAIRFLSSAIDQTGHNPKPVVLHSVRVGLILLYEGYSRDLVVAGVLHDILEDTATPPDEIERGFGREVRRLVEANSFDPTIDDWDRQYIEGFQRCIEAGIDAVRVKVADVLDNVWLYDMEFLRKPKYFCAVSQPIIGGEALWKHLDDAIARHEASLPEL